MTCQAGFVAPGAPYALILHGRLQDGVAILWANNATNVFWPQGYVARLEPGLIVYDAAGIVRGREGRSGGEVTPVDPIGLRRFAEDYALAWRSVDPDRVARHFAANGSLAVNDGPPAIGRAAIAATAQGFYTALPDIQVYFAISSSKAPASNSTGRSPVLAPGLAEAGRRFAWSDMRNGRSTTMG